MTPLCLEIKNLKSQCNLSCQFCLSVLLSELCQCLCTAFVCIFSCPAACAFLFPGPHPVQLCQLSLVCLLQWSTPALPLAIRFTGSLSAGYHTVYPLCTGLQFLLDRLSVHGFVSEEVFWLLVMLHVCPFALSIPLPVCVVQPASQFISPPADQPACFCQTQSPPVLLSIWTESTVTIFLILALLPLF